MLNKIIRYIDALNDRIKIALHPVYILLIGEDGFTDVKIVYKRFNKHVKDVMWRIISGISIIFMFILIQVMRIGLGV